MTDSPAKSGPLSGIKILDLAGIGPRPYAGQLLADMRADVIVIDRPSGSIVPKAIDARGKKSIILELKISEAVTALFNTGHNCILSQKFHKSSNLITRLKISFYCGFCAL